MLQLLCPLTVVTGYKPMYVYVTTNISKTLNPQAQLHHAH